MDTEMIFALTPLLLVAFGIVLQLLLIAWRRSQYMILGLTIWVLLCALAANASLFSQEAIQVTRLLKVDSYGAFALALVALSALVVCFVSKQVFRRFTEVHDEYYVLLLLVVLGAGTLIFSDHFASLFLGFELLSIALVGLVGYLREEQHAVETGFKYLILSASASSFMLLGIAFIYSQTGSLSFPVEQIGPMHGNHFHLLGVLLLFVGIAFKLSLVPFHFWTPDVYQGAPTPITMLLATVSKVAIFVVLIKVWLGQQYFANGQLLQLVSVVAVLSMLIGNILALQQQNIKRLLGYSSIAHMGYLLIVLVVVSSKSFDFIWQTALFYLAAYALASLSIFVALVVYTAGSGDEQDIEMDSWQGLFWHKPLLSALIIMALLSLAGIPLSMGFIGKFYLLSYATQAGLWELIAALIIGSGISLFYYLRLIFVLFSSSYEAPKLRSYSYANYLLVVLLAITGLTLGLYPNVISALLISL